MKEEIVKMNENERINLNEELDKFEDFVESMFYVFQLAIDTKMYTGEGIKDDFSYIVEETYYEIDNHMIELKNLSSVIYECLKIVQAPEELFIDYLNRLKALKSKLENLKGMLYFMANEMEVTLNV